MKITNMASPGFRIGTQSGDASKNRIAELMKRKQEISGLKQSYRENAVKQGKSAKEIEAKMQEYDSTISEIDAEISKITAEKQKKAMHTENDRQNHDRNEIGKENHVADLQASSGIFAIQKNLQLTKSVQFARGILKTESLSYKPSFAFGGNPVKAAELSTRAERLEGNLSDIQKKINTSDGKAEPVASEDTETEESKKRDEESYNGNLPAL